MIHDLFAGAGKAAKTSRHTAGREPEMYDGDRDLCRFETTAVNSVRSIDRDCLTSLHQRSPAESAYPASVLEVQVVIVVELLASSAVVSLALPSLYTPPRLR